jgi:DNA-binding response OmpR family regulator
VHGCRILLIDDDRETRWALATVLRRDGAQVTEASDGEEGLRFLMRGQYDLCISDVCMPGLGGFGLYTAIRYADGPELSWARTLPVILVSGKVAPRDLAQALDAGVEEFLEKPCDPEELKARVRAVLRRNKLIHGSRARTHGDLADFGMTALAQALHLGGRTCRVGVQSDVATALMDFRRGQVCHAQYEEMGETFRGEDGAIRTLALERGLFEFLSLPEAAPRTVFEDTPGLLLRAANYRDQVDTGEIVKACAAPGALPLGRAPE